MENEERGIRRAFHALAASSAFVAVMLASMLTHSWKFLEDFEHGRDAQVPESELLELLRVSTQRHLVLEAVCGLILFGLFYLMVRYLARGAERPAGYFIMAGLLPIAGIAGSCGALFDERVRPMAMTVSAVLPVGVLVLAIGLLKRFGAYFPPGLKKEALTFGALAPLLQLGYLGYVALDGRFGGGGLMFLDAVLAGMGIWGLSLALRARRNIPPLSASSIADRGRRRG